MEMDGAVFGYQQSDEITIILRNDQSLESVPWFNNRIQKIVSVSSALVTLHFNKYISSLDPQPNLVGQAIFDARLFSVPSINEAINNLIWRQQDCIRNAISSAAYAELGKKYGKKTAQKMLMGKKAHDKLILLKSECDIDFDRFYPTFYRRGIAAYRTPVITKTKDGEATRNKWILDRQIPLFIDNKNFITNILNSGHDIFRAGNLIPKEI
jgi:tRNA(His) 5'-end guanylyltransferase